MSNIGLTQLPLKALYFSGLSPGRRFLAGGEIGDLMIVDLDKSDNYKLGSVTVKCDRRQMYKITGEIDGTSKNVMLLSCTENSVVNWHCSDTPHKVV